MFVAAAASMMETGFRKMRIVVRLLLREEGEEGEEGVEFEQAEERKQRDQKDAIASFAMKQQLRMV